MFLPVLSLSLMMIRFTLCVCVALVCVYLSVDSYYFIFLPSCCDVIVISANCAAISTGAREPLDNNVIPVHVCDSLFLG